MKKSRVILCDDINECINNIKFSHEYSRIVIFYKNKLQVEDVKEIHNEAYLSENDTKLIVIAGEEISNIVQNGLLKLIEEPNHNIYFNIIVLSSSMLLPTIKSRLSIDNRRNKNVQLPKLNINLSSFSYGDYYNFLREYGNKKDQEARLIVEAIFNQSVSLGIYMNSYQLDNFSKAYNLISLNSRFFNILSLLLFYYIKKIS